MSGPDKVGLAISIFTVCGIVWAIYIHIRFIINIFKSSPEDKKEIKEDFKQGVKDAAKLMIRRPWQW